MTCQHAGCSLDIFSLCEHHCMKNVCLEHLLEHGDIFLNEFDDLLNRLDKSTSTLITEMNFAVTHIMHRRQYEISRINRMYDEEQQNVRKRIAFAQAANTFVKEKQDKLIRCKQSNEYDVSQHDIEQIKSYEIEIQHALNEKQAKQEKLIIDETINESHLIVKNTWKNYSCPLFRPNVFGITLEHNIRLDCDGSSFSKYHLCSHFENYHRMLPECALRLKNAVVNGQSPDEVKLFSDDEIIYNQQCFVECPLTDATNIFGAKSLLSTLVHIPCTKKQLLLRSVTSHFQSYHKMKHDAAKKIFMAMKDKSLEADSILFESNERIGTIWKKNG